MNSAADGIEMRLIASGFVRGEWTATEIAQVIAPEVEALRARNEQLVEMVQRQEWTFERQEAEHAELEALRAQVQRVRDMCTGYERTVFAAVSAGYVASAPVASVANDLRRALNGERR